jgi:hypothetical protein
MAASQMKTLDLTMIYRPCIQVVAVTPSRARMTQHIGLLLTALRDEQPFSLDFSYVPVSGTRPVASADGSNRPEAAMGDPCMRAHRYFSCLNPAGVRAGNLLGFGVKSFESLLYFLCSPPFLGKGKRGAAINHWRPFSLPSNFRSWPSPEINGLSNLNSATRQLADPG